MAPGAPRVYLAGPDVFRRDAAARFALLTEACDRLGLQALTPSDGLMPAWFTLDEIARGICKENMELIRQSRGVIANLAPFRGLEPDSGTVFEVGVAVAMGLPVIAYGVPAGAYADRVGDALELTRAEDGTLRDPEGCIVEDLGLPLNLMISCSVRIAASADDAIKEMAALLDQRS
ncbi:nucleoside 2-deoxyribosyltransferase [Variovorax sp. PMC12]|nr:nucleoside 2-deoxyribosyltransferase [Variovorax sp. PMC12]